MEDSTGSKAVKPNMLNANSMAGKICTLSCTGQMVVPPAKIHSKCKMCADSPHC